MSNCMARAILVAGVALAIGACSNHGFGPKEYAVTNDTGLGATTGAAAGGSASGAKEKEPARGGTTSGAGGSTSASTPAPAGPSEKPEQRGNTPPGVSRDGQGPLGGAIVDPAGVVTKGR
jgi:hypothetical protein